MTVQWLPSSDLDSALLWAWPEPAIYQRVFFVLTDWPRVEGEGGGGEGKYVTDSHSPYTFGSEND